MSVTSPGQPPAKPQDEKRRKGYPVLVAVIAFIVILAAIIGVIYFASLGNTPRHNLSTVTEVQLHTIIGSPASNVTYRFNHAASAGKHPAGQQMTFNEPYTHIGSSGKLTITKVVASTPGFSLNKTSPALPLIVPNSPDMNNPNRAFLAMTFDTPSVIYNGPFEYTVYMDFSP